MKSKMLSVVPVLALPLTFLFSGCDALTSETADKITSRSPFSSQPPPSGTSFSADHNLTTGEAIDRLIQAGYSTHSVQSKYGWPGERNALAFNVGGGSADDTFIEIHEYPDETAANANSEQIISLLDAADLSSQAIPRTYLIGNLVTHIRSYVGGGRGADTERIASSIAKR